MTCIISMCCTIYQEVDLNDLNINNGFEFIQNLF